MFTVLLLAAFVSYMQVYSNSLLTFNKCLLQHTIHNAVQFAQYTMECYSSE